MAAGADTCTAYLIICVGCISTDVHIFRIVWRVDKIEPISVFFGGNGIYGLVSKFGGAGYSGR